MAGSEGSQRVTDTAVLVTVWIAEEGAYSDRMVVGVYATADAAKAAYPDLIWERREYDSKESWVAYNSWHDPIGIESYEVQA